MVTNRGRIGFRQRSDASRFSINFLQNFDLNLNRLVEFRVQTILVRRVHSALVADFIDELLHETQDEIRCLIVGIQIESVAAVVRADRRRFVDIANVKRIVGTVIKIAG